MAAETQYTANTGMVSISTANANLDGTGTLGTVLTAGALNGCQVASVTVKAAGTVTEGMVRLFIYDGTNTRLIQEIAVAATTFSGTNPANPTFEYTWNCNILLEAGYILKASTVNAESFNVIAQGLDWTYYATSVRPESTNYTANTGTGLMTTGTSSLTGSGTVNILTAGSATSFNGCYIDNVIFKWQVSSNIGMVRVFISNGTTKFLITEFVVPTQTSSGTQPTFSQTINLGNFQLQAGYSLYASAQNSENICAVVDARDWKYPS